MPCNTRRTTTVEVGKVNLAVMAKALEALGMQATVDEAARSIRLVTRTGFSGYFADGRLRIQGAEAVDVNAIKREYSKQSIIQTAARQNWQLRWLPNGAVEATKRSF